MTAISLLLIILSIYRVPSISNSRALSYFSEYIVDGEELLIDTISIYRCKSIIPCMQKLQEVFLYDTNDYIEHKNSLQYNMYRYDLSVNHFSNKYGSISIGENGEIRCVSTKPSILLNSKTDVIKFMNLLGYDAKAQNILETNNGYFIQPVCDNIMYSYYPATNLINDTTTSGAGLVIELSEGNMVTQLYGNYWTVTDKIYESVKLKSELEILEMIKLQFPDTNFSQAKLKYHISRIIGDPFNAILYPVWEITTQSSSMALVICNAVTGNIEYSLIQNSVE